LTLVAPLLWTILLTPKSSALRCYNCVETLDPNCRDRFDNSTMMSIDCDAKDAPYRPHVEDDEHRGKYKFDKETPVFKNSLMLRTGKAGEPFSDHLFSVDAIAPPMISTDANDSRAKKACLRELILVIFLMSVFTDPAICPIPREKQTAVQKERLRQRKKIHIRQHVFSQMNCAVGCRKVIQEVDEKPTIIRQCAYGGENVNGLKRIGNKGVRLYYYQCDKDECNGAQTFLSTAAPLSLTQSLIDFTLRQQSGSEKFKKRYGKKKTEEKIKRKEKQFDGETAGPKVAGIEIAGTETARVEMTESRTTAPPKRAFPSAYLSLLSL
uniref:Uncharacterized protein n=1 Tax=Romanomermis culicivorax TaxID=13658 RepID=A0A915HYI8_ROMCU